MNLADVTVRLALTKQTAVGAGPFPDHALTTVAGPTCLRAGDLTSWSGGRDPATGDQWFRVGFDQGFAWDGKSGLLVDVSYLALPWAQRSNPDTQNVDSNGKAQVRLVWKLTRTFVSTLLQAASCFPV